MAIGSNGDAGGKTPLDVQGGGLSAGLPAHGDLDGNSYDPLGNAGHLHWQAGYITRPGLDDRSGVFFAAVEMTRMPMAVSDPGRPDNPIVFVNRAFLDLTGYAEDDVLGRNGRFLQGEQTDPGTIEEIRAGIRERRAVAVDILNYKADGAPFWNALFIGPIFDEQGKLLYWFSSQVDVTRRRVSEQSFRQAQKMEAIGQLTAALAHDFNNILQVMTGNLEVIEQRVQGDAVACQAVKQAHQAADKAAKLTQQLLTFARKQRLEPRRVNLNALVVEFSDMLVRTLGTNVELRLDLKPGLPSCMLDPIHLEMALLNVVLNARDAMPAGGKVTVATTTVSNGATGAARPAAPEVCAALTVVDEGAGMTPEVARRATEPFFTTKSPGTGLGLSMVHGFVQQSHGRLEIDSSPGKGTTVRMIFPVAAERAVPEEPEGAAAPASAPASAPHTILLVEDSDDVQDVTQAYLRAQGYRVVCAQSGEEALQLLERGKERIDLLFSDVMMPGGMNGVALVEQVRQRFPDLPVLLTTGYMDELADQGINTSTLGILTKPYRRTELADRIRSALNRALRSGQAH